jgi:pilus assembly protein CpaC
MPMCKSREAKKAIRISIFAAVCFLCSTTLSLAGDYGPPGTQQPRKLQLVTGKSVILKTEQPVKRVSLADPEVASLILLSPREIYVTAKAAGTTNMILWQDSQVAAIYDLEVTYDISRLKQKIHQVLPDETQLRVFATHDSITLAGRLSSPASLSQVLALAEAYAPEGKVRNLTEVGGVHQVMMEVRVAEMDRSVTKRLGINFNYTRGGEFGVSALGGLSKLVKPAEANLMAGPLGLAVSDTVNALFRFNRGNTTWTGLIDALKGDGLVKILAEPTLIALSGKTASFLVGGEFPVPVPQGLGTAAIEYKPFGVGLSFTPTVLSDKKINIDVTPEVSELDFSTAVQIQGFVIPGLTARRASTVVELADGQSFAIAGLLKETARDAISKFPGLGDIPILGTLFRSRQFQKNETELVIIATPHLVKPLDMAKQSLPTDYYREPNDREFYLLGLMEGRGDNQPDAFKGHLEGDFGHAVPPSD